ncbi:DNA-binding MurR/RpiR family transcriptional regulator [Psychromicrobium silvestre]|uniref:DNA-binding MurR/RpiR family transcriptional regulator n=1 Tax=Psychromicrobium silvestre TaxID=1645614 RepID=A0A7Y9LVK8_9MICC|nr:MurR/RpiR family transcriptional regulator [Psychromicrobium silvestre]NYE96429.1 DNA-binding MurR/RpiR family transcriptional regulator [Psychromicrobium silvestre]
MSIQSTIHSLLPTLPPTARRIAELIVADPSVVLRNTISELAQKCQTSEPSVVRFCRTVGFSGYVQLRLALATEIGRETAVEPEPRRFGDDISPTDSLADAVDKVRFTELMAIEETLATVDLDTLGRAAEQLDQAERILLYGIGAGAVVAEDFRYKLSRIGRTAISYPDLHGALMGVALLRPNDMVVAFSHSGETPETVQFLRAAKAAGGASLAMTNVRKSRIVTEADLSLFTVVRETAFRSGAMASRIAQLALVDCLFVAIAQRSYESTINALERTRSAVQQRPGR